MLPTVRFSFAAALLIRHYRFFSSFAMPDTFRRRCLRLVYVTAAYCAMSLLLPLAAHAITPLPLILPLSDCCRPPLFRFRYIRRCFYPISSMPLIFDSAVFLLL